MMPNSLSRLIARPIYRLLFFLFTLILSELIIFKIGFFPEIFYIIPLIFLSSAIEYFRPGKKWFTFGLPIEKKVKRDMTLGLLFALIPIFLFLLVFIMTGIIRFSGNLSVFFFLQISILIFIISTTEELLFRGILFQSSIDILGSSFSIVLFSFVFGCLHLFNANVTFLSIINIILANFMMSMMFIKTRNLWMPISFHFFWNWGQAAILGSPVSGYNYGISLFQYELNKMQLLSGGSFGIEGSLLTTFFMLLLILGTIRFSSASPGYSSLIFKRNYQESLLVG